MNNLERVIPGNYFLTKSMEWATERFKEGQINLKEYWALKKFLVYYSYVFSNKSDFETDDVYKEVEKNFNDFIKSLPKEDQAAAMKYFFYRDIRNLDKIIKWTDFYDYSKQPQDKKKLYDYKTRAKKLYWMYLVAIGGQSEIKKDVLHNWIPNGKKYHELYDLIEQDTRKKKNETIYSILNDIAAPLRNIRQLFNYYGIFYKFKLNTKIEEYSTTQIGTLLVKGNIEEVAIIMEHQKLRVISQPPNAKIGNVKGVKGDSFFIEINPYLKILKYLNRNHCLTIEEFKYIISRNVPIDSDLNQLKEYINNFHRKGDKDNTDFTKELKKYIHGLNIIKDLSITSGKSCYEVENKKAFEKYYNFINFYKNIKNDNFRKNISKYKEIVKLNYNKGNFTEEYNVLKSWYTYITAADKSLLFTLMIYNMKKNEKGRLKYPQLYKFLNLTNEIYEDGLAFHKDSESGINIYNLYNNYFIENVDPEVEIKSEKMNIKSIEYMISKSNQKYNFLESNARKHINFIKSFYIHHNVTECDCCGKKTFLNKNNNPYLEYHHLVPLSNNGTDHVLNIFGICPMCHRKFHFCNKIDRKKMYQELKKNDTLANIDPQNYSLFDRYKYLYNNDKINLLGIEFLIDEGLFTKQEVENIILND